LKPTTVSLVHLGCARNLIDSELILARMAEEGLVVAGDIEAADVAVLNTCSFIGPARAESEGAIRGLLQRKRRGELSAVVVAGCLVQRYQHALETRFPEVDLFAEISDYRELARAVAGLARGDAVPRYLSAGGLREPERDGARLLSTPGSYAYLRISHGCDHTCSFCAIPAIRGPHRSKSIASLRAEARDLIAAGVREIVLVAEDSTAWGRDLGLGLPALVEALAELEGQHRLRLMYAYPQRFPWDLLPLLREHPRVIPYLDVPVQHVSTPVLRAMRRAGSGEQVRAILDRLLADVPGITLRTTLLLGFPGETEADARLLPEFVRQYGFGRLGAFSYSHEQGTAGFELDDDVPPAVKEERRLAVLAARDEVLAHSQRAWIGRQLEVLVDERHDGWVLGRPAQDAPEVDLVARVERCAAQVGERIACSVTGVDESLNLVCTRAERADR
jgi:ribosomal protein S12 methylthiotransferase